MSATLLYILCQKNYCLNKQITYSEEPIKQKWNGIAQHIAYTVQEKTGIMVLSFMATLEEVSVYSIYFLIMEGLRGFIYSVTSSFTSYLGNILAKGEKDKLLSNFTKIEWVLHTITVFTFASCAVLIIPFIRVYTQGISDAEYVVQYFPFIMCTAVGCRCLQLPYNIVVQAAGHFKETQNSAIIEPVIDVIISVLLVGYMGLSGVAIGMLVSIFYRMLYLSLYLTKRILQSSKRLLMKRLLVDILMAVAIYMSCIFINMSNVTYVSWILMALQVVTIAILVTFVINLACYRQFTKGFLINTILRCVHK